MWYVVLPSRQPPARLLLFRTIHSTRVNHHVFPRCPASKPIPPPFPLFPPPISPPFFPGNGEWAVGRRAGLMTSNNNNDRFPSSPFLFPGRVLRGPRAEADYKVHSFASVPERCCSLAKQISAPLPIPTLFRRRRRRRRRSLKALGEGGGGGGSHGVKERENPPRSVSLLPTQKPNERGPPPPPPPPPPLLSFPPPEKSDPGSFQHRGRMGRGIRQSPARLTCAHKDCSVTLVS